jgi:predicted lipoprotein with Yx(FWY)xxD motif
MANYLRRLVALAPIGAALALAACGSSTAASKSPPNSTAAPPASAAASASTSPASTPAPSRRAGAEISVRSSPYGRILRDRTDRTIYLFTHDRGTSSTCYGACATAWPPVLTKGAPAAGSQLHARLLGTTRRRGGGLQVTFNGHPLYYYVNDIKPGQILCQNAEEFSGIWLVVSPSGTAVR